MAKNRHVAQVGAILQDGFDFLQTQRIVQDFTRATLQSVADRVAVDSSGLSWGAIADLLDKNRWLFILQKSCESYAAWEMTKGYHNLPCFELPEQGEALSAIVSKSSTYLDHPGPDCFSILMFPALQLHSLGSQLSMQLDVFHCFPPNLKAHENT